MRIALEYLVKAWRAGRYKRGNDFAWPLRLRIRYALACAFGSWWITTDSRAAGKLARWFYGISE